MSIPTMCSNIWMHNALIQNMIPYSLSGDHVTDRWGWGEGCAEYGGYGQGLDKSSRWRGSTKSTMYSCCGSWNWGSNRNHGDFCLGTCMSSYNRRLSSCTKGCWALSVTSYTLCLGKGCFPPCAAQVGYNSLRITHCLWKPSLLQCGCGHIELPCFVIFDW